jgi:hypothetical protein
MKKKLTIILCLFPLILSSLTFEFEKIDEFAVSGDYGNFHRLLIEDNFMYALSHYGFEIHTVEEEDGELNRISVIPIEGEVDDIEKIGNNVFISVSSMIRWQSEILSAIYKIDVSDPYEPVIVNSVIFPENIINYVLRTYGDYLAYHKLEEISDDWIYTQLVFVDPITFEEILSFPINNWTCPLRENYFLLRRNYIDLIFDVYDYTDINNIQVVGSVDFVTCPTNFMKIYAINDDNLVLLGNESISIYDISDLSDIQLVSTYYRYNNASPFGDCLQIDNFLLIPSQSAGIEVVDIIDIENPILYDFWEYPIDELSIIDPCFMTFAGIIYDNRHLYSGTYNHGILLMNCQEGMIEYVNHFMHNRINRHKFQIYNNYLIASGFSKGLYVYDIENVSSPELIIILFENLDVRTFEIINDYIYLTYINTNTESYDYFRVYDILDISNPVLIWDELLNECSYLIINKNEPENIYIFSYVNFYQSVEIRKYDIADPGNIEQILFYEYPEIIISSFFYEGYLYSLGSYTNEGRDLFIFYGFEDEEPELLNQISNFTDDFKIQLIKSYLNSCPLNNLESDSFFHLDDPLNPELAFTIQNTSTGYNSYYIDNVLFSPCYYTVFLYDLENNPIGELESFDHFNLNSEYRGISFFSQGENDYFFCEQLECISTYNYTIETSAEDELPNPNISLSNYPNPFNPETKIVFNLPEEGNVKLEIYNIKGQKVKTLLDCFMSPGRSEMIWNGKDDNGKQVSSGVYFYKLQTPSKSYVRKCMLLK